MKKCTGLRFRLNKSIYVSEDRAEITEKRIFRLLKRKSCKCNKCKSKLDYFLETGAEATEIDIRGMCYELRTGDEFGLFVDEDSSYFYKIGN